MKQSTWQVWLMSWLAIFAVWFGAPVAKATSSFDPVLKAYKAEYVIYWRGIPVGSSEHELKQIDDARYVIEAKASPYMGFILPYEYYESSLFSIEGEDIRPQTYIFEHQEGSKDKQGQVVFDYEAGKVFAQTATPLEFTLGPGMQDKLTHTLLLRRDLIAGKTELTYPVAEDDEVKNYRFTVLGEEVIKTKLGPLNTIKVEHVSRRRRTTTLWLAKDLDYMIVKMSQYRKGKKRGGGEIVRFELVKK